MLYALSIDILYKQQINRTFIERDKKIINKKIKKRLSNQQMNQNIKIDPYGFREYDARWLYEKDINSEGITNLGKIRLVLNIYQLKLLDQSQLSLHLLNDQF